MGGTSCNQHLQKEFRWVAGERTSKRLVVPHSVLKSVFADVYSTLEKIGHDEGLFAAFYERDWTPTVVGSEGLRPR